MLLTGRLAAVSLFHDLPLHSRITTTRQASKRSCSANHRVKHGISKPLGRQQPPNETNGVFNNKRHQS